MRRTTFALAAVCVWAFISLVTALPVNGATTRTVYVTVVDRSGQSVPGLTPADFVVKEGGKVRTVASAAPATEKIRLALVVVDSLVEQPVPFTTSRERLMFQKVADSADRTRMRDGLGKFVERLCPSAEIALFTVNRQIERLVDYTSDPNALIGTILQLPEDKGPAAMPSEAVLAVAKQFEREKPARPVIVVAMPGGLWGVEQERLVRETAQSKAQVWTVSIGQEMPIRWPNSSFQTTDAHDLARQLGGREITMLDSTGFQASLQQVADDLSSQYLLTYTLPDDAKASDRLSVSLTKPGVTVRAPSRVPTR
jgi:VWFA-related protein